MLPRHRSRVRLLGAIAGFFPLIFLFNDYAGAEQPGGGTDVVQAVWKPVEIRYTYVGYTVLYSCSAFDMKMKAILTTLGAHPRTKVYSSGCDVYNRPYRNFLVTITTAVPVPSQGSVARDDNDRKLIDKLGGQKAISDEPFAAIWKTVDLSNDRQVDLQPGDCELMQGLRDEVLPKLSATIVSEGVNCMPGQTDINTPRLVVSALTPQSSPEAARRGY